MINTSQLFHDLQGKTAIVTGAARGIGYAIAECLADAGVTVLAVDMKKLGDSHPAQAQYIADVSTFQSVQSMMRYCLERIGSPDILVNAAAVSRPSLVVDMTIDAWYESISVNLSSVFLCTHAVLPHMIDNKTGSIINFSSIVARTGGKTSASYAAAKSGIEGFTRSIAHEVGPQGIRVNVISPGMVDTDMLALMPAKQKAKLARKLPLQRIGTPDDFKGIALLLCSNAGSYITGQTIHVNGGMFMG